MLTANPIPAMRVACLGGGPAGLYLAISMKLREPAARDRRGRAQPARTTPSGGASCCRTRRSTTWIATTRRPRRRSADRFVYWDDIAVHYRGQVMRSGGHGFSGIGRRRLLNILQDRAGELGVELRFETEIASLADWRAWDLVVGADGVNSQGPLGARARLQARRRRPRRASTSGSARTRSSTRRSRSCSRRRRTAGSGRTPTSSTPTPPTFIVECAEETWRRAGFDRDGRRGRPPPPASGSSPANLGGHRLMTNAAHLRGSAWLNFNRVLCERWSHEQRRPARRRGGDGALFHRLGNEAGDGERHRAGRLRGGRARPAVGVPPATRTSGASRC